METIMIVHRLNKIFCCLLCLTYWDEMYAFITSVISTQLKGLTASQTPPPAFAFIKLTGCSLLLCLSWNESVIMWMTLMKLDLTSVCLALFLGLIFMVLFEIFRINSYRGQTPPGPKPLLFVGVLPHLIKNPMEFKRSVSLCCVPW